MNILWKSFYNWYRQTLRNPRYGWLVIAISIVYLFSPLDISPDLIPIVGQIDDLAIISILATEILNLISQSLNKSSKPKETDDPQTYGETIDVQGVSID